MSNPGKTWIVGDGAGVPDDFPEELVRRPDRSVEVPRHDQEALDLRNNPETPVWLSHAIGYALTRDPVDVWQQLDVVTEVFKRRMDAIFREHSRRDQITMDLD